MLILLVQIQDSQVFINYHKLQAMSFYMYHSNSTKDHNQQHNYQKQLKIFFPLEVLAIAVRQDKKIKRHPDWKGISETLVFSVT